MLEVIETDLGKFTNNTLLGLTAQQVYEKELKRREQIDICLDETKNNKIVESKQLLAKWLEGNPLFSKVHSPNGEYYTVTDEKQSLLSRNLMLAQLSQSATTTWNSTSNICEEWTIIELSQLALEIEAYVRPRIVKQQHYEVMINYCTTKEELDTITFDYEVI